MFSDGLTEARNADDEEFGDLRLQQAISKASGYDIYHQIFAMKVMVQIWVWRHKIQHV